MRSMAAPTASCTPEPTSTMLAPGVTIRYRSTATTPSRTARPTPCCGSGRPRRRGQPLFIAAMRATPCTLSAACSTTVRSTRRAIRTEPSWSSGVSSRSVSSAWSGKAATAGAGTPAPGMPAPMLVPFWPAIISRTPRSTRADVRRDSMSRRDGTIYSQLYTQSLAHLRRHRRDVGCRAHREGGRVFGDALDQAREHLPGADLDEGAHALVRQPLDGARPLDGRLDLARKLRSHIHGQRERPRRDVRHQRHGEIG